jgi:hypothetical protein
MQIGLNNLGLTGTRNPFSPNSIFTTGVDGVVYEQDLNGIYQDSAGTTAGALEQPEGLVLDRRFGYARGSERAPALDAANWSAGSGVSIAGGSATFTAVAAGVGLSADYGDAFVAGRYYEATYVVSNYSTGNGISVRLGNSGSFFGGGTGNGAKRVILPAGGSTNKLQFLEGGGNGTYTVTLVSVRELPGNHATQSTSASRPELAARVNLLTATEGQFDGASWTKTLLTATADGALTEDATAASQRFIQYTPSGVAPIGTNVEYLEFKQGIGSRNIGLRIAGASGSAYAIYNPSTGELVTSGATGVNHTLVSAEPAVATTDGYFRARITVTSTELGTPRAQMASGSAFTYDGDGTSTIHIRHPDLRTSADAALNIPLYQWVDTANSYDTVGFPYYALFDGTDDFWTSAAGGGGATGFFFCAAIHVLGGAGASRRLWSDENANSGYIVNINTSNQLALLAGNGAAYTTAATTATLPVGETHVVTAWDDGTNLNVQVDNGTVTSVARPVVAAGSAGFTRGRTNGASSSHFNGREYASTYAKNYSPSASVREQVKQYVAAKAGLSL